MLAIERIDTRQSDVKARLAALRQKLSPRGNVVSEAGRLRTIEVFGEPLSPQDVVERICEDVRTLGVAAVLDYAKKIDKAELKPETMRVSADKLADAHRRADGQLLKTIRQVRDKILRFQKSVLPQNARLERGDGSYLEQRYVPLRRVGCCVPGGAAAYPSTVLMTAVPAQAAGVKEIVVVAPPTPFGAYNIDMLATCHELGIQEVYALGGAQAVAAMAFGIEGLPAVDKIVGPGNLFVALAKKYVFGEVDIDSIAGPSEVVVIADSFTRPDFTAADMLAQAEHAPGSSILITWDEKVLSATADELERQAAKLSRGDLARQSLEDFGALILTKDADEACALATLLAPEHLHIATDNGEQLLAKIPTAGAAFLGNYSPVAIGDYVAGPSHVLPTGGTARFASGLSARDFFRSHSVIHYSREALAADADAVRCLADKEGLSAHRQSVDIRLS